jgi:hypothetical protein
MASTPRGHKRRENRRASVLDRWLAAATDWLTLPGGPGPPAVVRGAEGAAMSDAANSTAFGWVDAVHDREQQSAGDERDQDADAPSRLAIGSRINAHDQLQDVNRRNGNDRRQSLTLSSPKSTWPIHEGLYLRSSIANLETKFS